MNKQLNPFEIKAELNTLQEKLKGVQDFSQYEIHFKLLDAQDTKGIIIKLLLKELINVKANAPLIKFLLIRYGDRQELNEKLWEIIKNPMVSNLTKIVSLDILRDITTDWTYEECENFLDAPEELIDADTKRLLTAAVINPEVQIDFLDFLTSLKEDDKFALINSLADDYSGDELANILIPVFISEQTSKIGERALELLGESKSELALHALTSDRAILPTPKLKKAISTLKIAGIKEENAVDFYKKLLSQSVLYKFYTAYPDGEGNQSVIFSRVKPEGRVQFVAVVINDFFGVRECFGFNDISKFECDTIIERFYRDEQGIKTNPKVIRKLLDNAEKISVQKGYKIPYEYICWKNILADIEVIDESIKSILDKGFQVKPLDNDGFSSILNTDFVQLWFMQEGYSDEFDMFIRNLDDVLRLTPDKDLDEYIEQNLNEVFYSQEIEMWKSRLLNSSFLSIALNQEILGQNLYNLYCDEKYLNEFFKYILRKSIYEYYSIKQATGQQPYISEVIKNIEKKWVE